MAGRFGLDLPEGGVNKQVVGLGKARHGRCLGLVLWRYQPLIAAVDIPKQDGFGNGRFNHKRGAAEAGRVPSAPWSAL